MKLLLSIIFLIIGIVISLHILAIITIVGNYHKQICPMSSDERQHLIEYYSDFTKENYIRSLPNCKDKFDSGDGWAYSFPYANKKGDFSLIQRYVNFLYTNILMTLYKIDTYMMESQDQNVVEEGK